MSKYFISHASKDKVLVDAFITNLMLRGLNIIKADIFCTSIEDMRIKSGEDFRNKIVMELKSCEMIILIVTQNYKRSEICLNEMGAAWVFDNKSVVPFICAGVDYKNIGFIHGYTQALRLESENDLIAFKDDHFGNVSINIGTYRNEISKVIAAAKKSNQQILENEHDYQNRIQRLKQKLKRFAVLKSNINNIVHFLNRIETIVLPSIPVGPICLIVTGTSGSGKTTFAEDILPDFLTSIQRIKHNRVIKIKPSLLESPTASPSRKAFMADELKKAKGGVLILDDFTANYKYLNDIIHFIQDVSTLTEYSKTCVVFMGHATEIKRFIEYCALPIPYHDTRILSMRAPNNKTIVSFFEEYARESNFELGANTKDALKEYFTMLKLLKEQKKSLRNTMVKERKFPLRECKFGYIREVMPLFESIYKKDNGNKIIHKDDVYGSLQFKRTKEEFINVFFDFLHFVVFKGQE